MKVVLSYSDGSHYTLRGIKGSVKHDKQNKQVVVKLYPTPKKISSGVIERHSTTTVISTQDLSGYTVSSGTGKERTYEVVALSQRFHINTKVA